MVCKPLHSVLIAASSLISPAWAQWNFVEEARLYPPTLTSGQGFATTVDIHGDTAVVGAPRMSTGYAGVVFVYTRSGGVWTEQAQLTALDSAVDDGFGSSLALEGNTLVVGAEGVVTSGLISAGAAYVFTRSGTTWTQQQKLIASDPQQAAAFGHDVAISGDTCAAGAPNATTNNIQYAGATYVFTRSGGVWSQQQRILPNDALQSQWGSRSATSIALSGNTLLIGAPNSLDLGNNQSSAGAVYVWTRAGSVWSQIAELGAIDDAQGRQFGTDVAFDGSRAVIGAWSEHQLPTAQFVGTAYVFKASNWTQEVELVGTGINHGDWFGADVDIDGTTVVVGAQNGASVMHASSGTVRLFDFDGTTWSERLALFGSATGAGDALGVSVAIHGDSVIGGANTANTPIGATGEAYVWHVVPPATSTYCTAKTNSLGCVPAVGSSGIPSATSAVPFFVTCTQMLNQKQGLCFYGYGPASTPFQGGYLCVAPPTRRLPATSSGGSVIGSDCTGAYSYELNALIQSGSDPALVAGADMYCQFWARDPASPSTTSLSAGLRAHIQP